MGKTCSNVSPVTKVGGIDVMRNKPCNVSNYTNMASRTIDYIVFHYTGNVKDTAIANANYFMGANRDASAHYIVDDISIYQIVDINDKAWHCGTKNTYYHDSCRNSNSIGIEMCCTAGNYKVGAKTLENSAQLGAALCKYLGITDVDKYVLRHYDVTHKKCPAQMAGANNVEWIAFKKRIKEIMNQSITGSSSSSSAVTFKVGDEVKLVSGAKYSSGKSIPDWVFSSKLYVRELQDDNVVISTQKTGAITGVVNKKYLVAYKGTNTFKSYKVQVTTDALNIRKGPGTNYDVTGVIRDEGIYTIIAEKNGWGQLKSKQGWISLKYTKKI